MATRSSASDPHLLWRRAAWVGLAAAWLFLIVSAVSFSPADPPAPGVFPLNDPVANWCGRFGAAIAYFGYELIGMGFWVLILLGGVYLFATAGSRKVGHIAVRFIGAVIMAIAFAALQALLLPESGPIPGLGGGLVGTLALARLRDACNSIGSFFVISATFAVGSIVALDVWAFLAAIWAGKVVARAGRGVGGSAGKLATSLSGNDPASGRAGRTGKRRNVRLNDVDDDEAVPGRDDRARKPRKRLKLEDEEGSTELIETDAKGVEPDAPVEITPPRRRGKAAAALADEDEADSEAQDEADTGDGVDEYPPDAEPSDEKDEDDAPGAPQVFDPEALREKIARLPLRFAAANRRSATDDDLRDIQNVAEMEGYRFPGLDLLEEPEQNYSAKLEAFVREQAEALERSLKEYRIDGSVVGIDSGPVITNYEVRLAPGTKVAALSAIASDLARSLKAINIRIVPNTAGRDTVGIEVPNSIKEKVRLKELMTKADVSSKMALPMFLGKDASGEPLIADLTTMPHLLIAGTTGSGKSVCMNTVIMSFLYTKKPNELKLVLVDPKMVEMSQFKDIPHLMCPVVTEMGKAAAILEWAVGKMEERYELLAEAGCRDIASYNTLTWDELKDAFTPQTPEEEARIPRKLPYMVFVIDELADLMMTNKEVEHSIVRIAQKARAVGIHLIIATQRPQANVVTGLIKSNMPARIAFKVASGMDSRIIMDQKGGELLLGQGDMLYLSPRSHKLMRAQGTLVDDREIRRVVKFMREVAAPTFERQLVQIRSGGASSDGLTDEQRRDGFANAQEDPLFDKAVEIVLETKLGSVSMLQRRLAIGYTRSARLIEMMGEAGILGSHKGTVARDVLMSLEEWRALNEQAAADEQARADADDIARRSVQADLFPEAKPSAASPAATEEADTAGATEVDSPSGYATDLDDDAPPFEADVGVLEDEDEFPDAFQDDGEEDSRPASRGGGRR
ncbi:MAG: DNA translocase FtsK 4TM domain-containing protein [Phycisphaerales bacterium]|nr:DNA translocase FtsK 4TM domain-containing protein [Phycisphaerales bacterium]